MATSQWEVLRPGESELRVFTRDWAQSFTQASKHSSSKLHPQPTDGLGDHFSQHTKSWGKAEQKPWLCIILKGGTVQPRLLIPLKKLENHALKEADRPKDTFQNATGIQSSHTYEQKEHIHITQCEQGSQAEIRQECSVLRGSLEIAQLRLPVQTEER